MSRRLKYVLMDWRCVWCPPPSSSSSLFDSKTSRIHDGCKIQQRWLLFAPIDSHSMSISMVFALLFVSYFLSFSCSALPSTSFRSLQYICALPAFDLCNLDDTIFFWTWLALSQLSYCSLFHEHHPISLLFPSLSSLLLIELFAIVVTKIDCNQWLLLRCLRHVYTSQGCLHQK